MIPLLFSLPDPFIQPHGRSAGLTGLGIAVLFHGLIVGAVFHFVFDQPKPKTDMDHAVTFRFVEPPQPAKPPVIPVVIPVPSPPIHKASPPKTVAKPLIIPTTSRTEATATTVSAPPLQEAPVADTPAPVAPPPTPQPVFSEARFDAAYLNNPKPIYPPSSRRMGESGRVYLRVRVGEDGSALEVVLKTSSGSPRLDQSAQDAVIRWKFVPARNGTNPVTSWVVVPVDFTLDQ
jgi:protein TonB